MEITEGVAWTQRLKYEFEPPPLGVAQAIYCANCGTALGAGDRFCPSCRAPVEPISHAITYGSGGAKSQSFTRTYGTKNPFLAAFLAFAPALIGLWGVGDIYIGKVRRGLSFMVGGIFSVLIAIIFGGEEGLVVILPAGVVIGLGSAVKVYNFSKQHNADIRSYTR